MDGDISKLQGRYDELYGELDNFAILEQYGIVIPDEDVLTRAEAKAKSGESGKQWQ